MPTSPGAASPPVDPSAAAAAAAGLPRLTRLQFWSIFGTSLAIFLFAHGPIWKNPWGISALNDAIFWSYVPIPLLVAAALAFRRRLGLRAFFLDTLELTLLKYATTFGLALVLWSIKAPPDEPFAFHGQPAVPAVVQRPTIVDPLHAGQLGGVVQDAAGAPVAGAFVFVAGGLEGVVFAAPPSAVEIVNDGAAIAPSMSAAVIGQTLEARSTDGRMHTLVAVADGTTIFNVPLLPAGVRRAIEVSEPHPFMELRCTVHPAERHAHLAVLSHPFFATTGADGRFRFAAVPEGKLRLAVSRDGATVAADREIVVQGGREAEETLRLAAP